MKIEDVRGFTPDQLTDGLANLKKEQFNLRFQAATGQLDNASRLKAVKRDIARIITIRAERQAAPERQ